MEGDETRSTPLHAMRQQQEIETYTRGEAEKEGARHAQNIENRQDFYARSSAAGEWWADHHHWGTEPSPGAGIGCWIQVPARKCKDKIQLRSASRGERFLM